MYYSSFGILAVILHLIINHNLVHMRRRDDRNEPRDRYRHFLYATLVFYITDLMWGFLVESRIRPLAYADTLLFFASMALSVLLWTRYVVAYLGKKGTLATVFRTVGWCIFAFVLLALAANFFFPVIYTFTEDTEYVPGFGRYILLIVQFLLFICVSVYSFIVARRSEGSDKIHYMAVSASGGVMAVLIVVQTLFPFAPFYTIGCLIANCVIHVFVEEDQKKVQQLITADAKKEKERYSQIAASLAEDFDAIYYIDIASGRYLEISSGVEYRSLQIPESGDDFYADSRENVIKHVHPDDRVFAESMYYRDTIQMNLSHRGTYSYKYRIMIGDEARYFRFVVKLAEDGDHFVMCSKDIQDTITAETALIEKQKANVTFAQIAESLASNYDVIYYVDAGTGEYVGYTSKNIFGELKVDESGDDFFADTRKTIGMLIHPLDRERMLTILDRDYFLTTLERRKQFDHQYRLIVNDRVQHTRLSVRSSSDHTHMIIGVENIEDEIIKEKEHLRALNTEKELARRDELTGVKNKTAFTELEKAIQENIETRSCDMPFAIVVCDLNDLKKINDTRGHKAGDDYIIASSKLMCGVFDHSPIFRIGGDEFAIYLTGHDYDHRKELLEKLQKTVRFNLEKHDGPVIASGLAEYDRFGDESIYDIVDRADHLMYEDKRELKAIG